MAITQEEMDTILSRIDKMIEKWTWDRYQRIERDLLPKIDKSAERWTWERFQRLRGEQLSQQLLLEDVMEEVKTICTLGGGSRACTEEYDLIVPIGPACRPAHQLQRHNLRRAAFPLDWMMDFSLDSVAHLLETGFADFFMEIAEDIERSKKLNPGVDQNRFVRDMRNQIVSIHHFPKKLSLDEGREDFEKKMKPRAKRFLETMKNSSRTAMVCNRNDSMEDLAHFLDRVHRLYPSAELTLLNIRHNEDMVMGGEMKVERMDNGLLHIRDYEFNDQNEVGGIRDYWKGNLRNWHGVLKCIEIKHQRENA